MEQADIGRLPKSNADCMNSATMDGRIRCLEIRLAEMSTSGMITTNDIMDHANKMDAFHRTTMNKNGIA